MSKHNEDVEREVASDFEQMQRSLEESQPGIMNLLKVYGGYEAAVHQAQQYLGILSPRPIFLTTDKSSF